MINNLTTELKLKSGFTLIELLVVISIISLLSSIMLESISTAKAKARDAKRLNDARNVVYALTMYYDDQGGRFNPTGWTTSVAGLCDPANGPCLESQTPNNNFLRFLWSGDGGSKKYLSSVPLDPLNRGYSGYDPAIDHFFYEFETFNNGQQGVFSYFLEATNPICFGGVQPYKPGEGWKQCHIIIPGGPIPGCPRWEIDETPCPGVKDE